MSKKLNGPKMFIVTRTKGDPSITVASQLRQSVRRILRNREKDQLLDMVQVDPELVRLALADHDERMVEYMQRWG